MVSHIAASVLSKYLGDYIDDLNKDNIKLSFLSGDAVLQDLKIKKTVLQSIFPNVIVKQAIIKKLSLHIPWSDLKGKPAIIKIEGIYVLAEPSSEFDEQYYRKKFHDEKIAKLNIQELLRINKQALKQSATATTDNNTTIANTSTSTTTSTTTDESSTFGSKLLQTVIDNLQLYIDSVHIRFEDSINKQPFSFGVMLNSLVAESTGPTWVPTFIKNETTIIHKLVNLNQLSIYWNSNSPKLKYDSIDDLSNKLKKMIKVVEKKKEVEGQEDEDDEDDENYFTPAQDRKLQFIIEPISAKLKVIINKSIIPSEVIPKYSLNFEFGASDISLSDLQYRDITGIMESFTMFEKSIEFRSARPSSIKEPIKKQPRKWWNYSINCILSNIRKQRYIHSWEYIAEFLHHKRQYIDLYRKLKKKSITTSEQVILDSLEWKLSFDHILLFRNLSHKMIDKEDKLIEKEKKLQQQLQQQSMSTSVNNNVNKSNASGGSSGGWLSSWWKPIANSTVPTGTSSQPIKLRDVELSKEDWNEIYDTIGYDENDENQQQQQQQQQQAQQVKSIGKDFSNVVKAVINFRLVKGGIKLKKNKKTLALLLLNDISLSLKSKSSSSFQFNANLKGLELIDHSTPNTQFSNLISPLSKRQTSSSSSTSTSDKPSNIFNITFESLPISSTNNVNYNLSIQSKPLTIVYYPKFISTINDFFFKKTGGGSEDTEVLEDLEKKAQQTIDSIKSQTRDKLLLAISNKTTISIDMKLEAPIILIPESITNKNTNLLILDLGKLTINHTPKVKQIQDHQSNSPTSPTTTSVSWEEEFYDEYLFKLINTQVLLSNLSNDWRDLEQVKRFRMNIANPFNANFTLKISKLNNNYLTSLKLMASIELLEFYLSSCQYVDLMNIVQSVTSVDNQIQQQSGNSIMGETIYLSTFESIYNTPTTTTTTSTISPPTPIFKSPVLSSVILPPIIKKKKSYSKEFIDSYKMFEASFNVDKFNIHLRLDNHHSGNENTTSTDTTHNVALVYLRCLQGKFDQKLYDTNLELLIKGMWIEDCFLKTSNNGSGNNNGNGRNGNGNDYLATTTNRFKPDDINIGNLDHSNIIKFKFQQVSSDSPFYNNIDKLMDVQLSQINLILNRKTVAGLIEFSNSVSNLSKIKLNHGSGNSGNNQDTPMVFITSPPSTSQQQPIGQSIYQSSSLNASNSSNDTLSASTYIIKNSGGGNKITPPLTSTGISNNNNVKIFLKATFKIDLVRILLTRENNNPLIKASFTGFNCTTDQYNYKTCFNGKLGSLKIHDMTTEGRNYRTILTTRERKVPSSSTSTFEMDIDNFDTVSTTSSSNSATSSSTIIDELSLVHFQYESRNDNNSQLLKVQLSSIRFIFLKRFTEELRLFLNNVNIMREYLKSSIYSAASAISQNRSTLFYEIEIENPYIVIPLSSLSNKIFIVDLGKICIKNQFEKLAMATESPSTDESSILIENIMIDANNIKLLSGLNTEIKTKSTTGRQQRSYGTMVSDVNVSIKLKTPLFSEQNLKQYLYSKLQLPAWEQHFTISQFELNVSEFEMKCMIDLLDGNLSEFSSEIINDANSSLAKQKEIEIEQEKKLIEQQQQTTLDNEQQEEDDENSEKNKLIQLIKQQVGYTFCKLGKFSIMYLKRDGTDIDDRMVLFYISETKMDVTKEIMETSMLIEIKSVMMKDFSKDTHNQLRNILSPLQDNDSGSSGMSGGNSQIIIKGSIKPPPIQQSLFQITINGLFVIFVPHSWIPVQDSIIKLSKFATEAWNRYTIKVYGESPVSDEIIQSGLSLFSLTIKDIKISLPGDCTVKGNGELEYSLFIRSSLDIQTTSRGAMGVETITLIEANHIQIYRSQFQSLPNSSSTSNLNNSYNTSNNGRLNIKMIAPFKIIFQTTSTLLNSESNLSIDNIVVTFSYQDFKLVMKIINSMIESSEKTISQDKRNNYLKKYKDGDEGDDGDNEVDPKLDDDDESDNQNYQEAIPVKENSQLQKYLSISIDRGEFILNDDHNIHSPIPLLSIGVSNMKSNVFSFPQKNQMALSLEANTQAGYFNKNIGIWEPLIENWGFSFTSNNSVQGGWMVNFSSKLPLQINITKIFIDTSISTYQIWADDYYNSKNNGKDDTSNDDETNQQQQQKLQQNELLQQQHFEDDEKNKKYPYYIKNDTGVEIWYWIKSDEICKVEVGKEVGFDPNFNQLSTPSTTLSPLSPQQQQHPQKIELEKKISFQLFGDFKPISRVPMDSIGTYTLHPMPEYKNIKLLYDISYRSGAKVLSLHSNFNITNNTDIPVLVHITAIYNKIPKSIEMLLNPHVKIPIPVEFTIGRIKYKPYNLGYDYSAERIDCTNIIQLFKSSKRQHNNNIINNLTNTIGNNNNQNNNNNNSSTEKNLNQVSSKMICKHDAKLPFVFLSSIEKNMLENKNTIEISINTAIMIENVLACDMQFRLYHGKNKKIIGSPFISGTIPMGKKLPILVYDPLLDIYMEFQIYDFNWSSIFLIDSMVGLSIPEKIKVEDKKHQPLLISFDNRIQPNGGRFVTIYCEYWLINQTGLPLYFRHHIGAQTIDPAGQISSSSLDQQQQHTQSIADKPSDSRNWYSKDWNHPSLPFMFAYNDSSIVGGRFSLKIYDSNWSSPFSLNSNSTSTSNIQINEEKTDEEKEIKNVISSVSKKNPPKTNYNLSVSILPSNSKFWRTKVVTFSPMYLLVNTTKYRILYQQFDCDTLTQSIIQDQSLPFQFPSNKSEKLIRIGILDTSTGNTNNLVSNNNSNNNNNNSNIKWSGYFNPQLLGQVVLRLRNEDSFNSNSNSGSILNIDKKDSEISTKKRTSSFVSNLLQKTNTNVDQQSSSTSSLPTTPTPSSPISLNTSNSSNTSTTVFEDLRLFINVTIRVKASKSITTTMIILNEQNPELPPYRINNKSRFPLWIRQKKTEIWDKIPAKTSIPYAWDHPILPKKLVIEFPTGTTKTYRLGNLEENSIVSVKIPNITSNSSLPEKVDFQISIIANGPTRVLIIKERDSNSPPLPLSPQFNSSAALNENTTFDDEGISGDAASKLSKHEFSVDLSSIGISIINKIPTREEIVYISIDGLKLEVKQSKLDQYIQFKIDDFQIDDQRYSTNFPVFLCQSKKINHSIGSQQQSQSTNNSTNTSTSTSTNSPTTVPIPIQPKKPFLQFSATRTLKYSNIIFFRYFSVLIQEFDINVDESSILNALSFININLNSLNEHFTLHPTITQEEILETKNASNIENHMIYFELLHINPVRVNLSFTSCKSPKETQAILGARSLAELLIGFKSNSPFLNIERAPIKFNGFIWEHPFLSTRQIIDEISLHFSYQMMSQAHKIFGSFDFIGNPIRLAESLGSGFKDFFHEPAMGIVKSPQDFAAGLSKGTSSLVNNSVFGFADSASKITGTISKGLVQLSLDDQYIRERQESNKQKPKGVKEGLEFGFRDFGEGLIKGVTGIIDEPFKGATQEKTWEGFFKGIGKGVIGVAVKPTVGVFDLVSRTSEGIKNSTTIAKSLNQIKRRRIPRYFPREGTLSIYNSFKSTGSFILYSKIGPPPTNDWYVFHVLLTKDLILIGSNYHLLLIRMTNVQHQQSNNNNNNNNNNSGGIGNLTDSEIIWKVKFSDIIQIKNNSSNFGIQLSISNGGDGSTPPNQIVIPTSNDDSRNSVVRKINDLILLVRRFGNNNT